MPKKIVRSKEPAAGRHGKWTMSAHGKRERSNALPANASLGITINGRDPILSDS
jgi:hypothetical protein